MLTRPVSLPVTVVAAALPLAGLILGILITKIAVRRSRQGERAFGPAVVRDIREMLVVCLTIAGAYGSTVLLPLSRDTDAVARKALVVLVIGAATLVAARLSAGAVRRFVLRTAGSEAYGSIFLNITRLVVVSVGMLVVLQSLGISITPILTALGVGGLAVALALQDTLANLFAGLHVIASKYVKGGDYVRLDTGEEGWVVDINWRHTSLRQIPDNLILVPNAKLASTILTNFHRPSQPMSVPVEVGVSYDSDLEHVERVTLEVARGVLHDVSGGEEAFEPFVWYNTFNDFSIDFTVYLRVREYYHQYPVQHEFIKRLHRRYNQEGIVIPFPIRTLVWKDGPPARHDVRDGDGVGHSSEPPTSGWRSLIRRATQS